MIKEKKKKKRFQFKLIEYFHSTLFSFKGNVWVVKQFNLYGHSDLLKKKKWDNSF